MCKYIPHEVGGKDKKRMWEWCFKVMKTSYCSSRGWRFGSQYPHVCSQLSATLVYRGSHALLWPQQAPGAHTTPIYKCRQTLRHVKQNQINLLTGVRTSLFSFLLVVCFAIFQSVRFCFIYVMISLRCLSSNERQKGDGAGWERR